MPAGRSHVSVLHRNGSPKPINLAHNACATLPATGNPDFERIFRVHMNMLEWMPTFLVPLWLCAIYLNDIVAALLGLVWIGGRFLYYTGYSKAVEKRLPGFFTPSAACILLFVGAIVGIAMHWSGS